MARRHVLFRFHCCVVLALTCFPIVLVARERTPLPFDAYDGGILSAEALGRGGTIASNQGSMASGSENPAALMGSANSSVYTTAFVGESSERPESLLRSSDTLRGRVIQYLSMGAEKGTLYYEPLGRREEKGGSTEFEFSADALGIAAGEKYKGGSVGLSFAYLRASLASTVHSIGLPDQTTMDTADGLRMNVGLRYPTGAFMWGLVLQNAPGFLWWKDFRRDMLPFTLRVGNTWRLKSGVLFSAESETRYYNEGGRKTDFLHFGTEASLGPRTILRAGVFADDIQDPDQRHWTGGLSFKFSNDVSLSYAIESYFWMDEKVKKSFLSVQIPLSYDQAP